MDRLQVRHVLLDKGMTLRELAITSGMAYDRLIRVVNGYRPAKDEELEAIADALDLPAESIRGKDTGQRRGDLAGD